MFWVCLRFKLIIMKIFCNSIDFKKIFDNFITKCPCAAPKKETNIFLLPFLRSTFMLHQYCLVLVCNILRFVQHVCVLVHSSELAMRFVLFFSFLLFFVLLCFFLRFHLFGFFHLLLRVCGRYVHVCWFVADLGWGKFVQTSLVVTFFKISSIWDFAVNTHATFKNISQTQ